MFEFSIGKEAQTSNLHFIIEVKWPIVLFASVNSRCLEVQGKPFAICMASTLPLTLVTFTSTAKAPVRSPFPTRLSATESASQIHFWSTMLSPSYSLRTIISDLGPHWISKSRSTRLSFALCWIPIAWACSWMIYWWEMIQVPRCNARRDSFTHFFAMSSSFSLLDVRAEKMIHEGPSPIDLPPNDHLRSVRVLRVAIDYQKRSYRSRHFTRARWTVKFGAQIDPSATLLHPGAKFS